MNRTVLTIAGAVVAAAAAIYFWPKPDQESGPPGTTPQLQSGAGSGTELKGQPLPLEQGATKRAPVGNAGGSGPTPSAPAQGDVTQPLPASTNLAEIHRQFVREWSDMVTPHFERQQIDQALKDQGVTIEGEPLTDEAVTEIRGALLDSLRSGLGPAATTTPDFEADWSLRMEPSRRLMEEFVPQVSAGLIKIRVARAHDPAEKLGFIAATHEQRQGDISLECRSKNYKITLDANMAMVPREIWGAYEYLAKKHQQ